MTISQVVGMGSLPWLLVGQLLASPCGTPCGTGPTHHLRPEDVKSSLGARDDAFHHHRRGGGPQR